MRKLWESHKKVMRKSWESHNKIIRKSWKSHKKVMQKSWESHEKVMRKSRESPALIQLLTCLFVPVQLEVTLLITDPPLISFTILSKKRRRKKWHVTHDMWHMTCDMWHMTHDMWHVTHDTLHVTCCGGLTFSQNFSSLAVLVCIFMISSRLAGKGWLTELIN